MARLPGSSRVPGSLKGRPTKDGRLTNAQKQRNYRLRKKQADLRLVNGTPPEWQPEFPGQRPPFGPGNKLSVIHGADTPEIVDPLAVAAIEWLLGLPGSEYLRDPLYWPAIEGWGHARARVVLLRRYVAGKDIEGALAEITEVEEEGTTTPAVLRKYTRARNVEAAWRSLERAEAQLLKFEDRLGLSPLARVKLGKMAQNKHRDLALIWAAEDDGEAV